MSWDQRQMALEVAGLFHRGATINLGIGLPTAVAEIVSPDMDLMLHSENGILGVGDRPTPSQVSATLINAGKETITAIKGASYFDSALSFGMIRGGHIDFCVLGGMEVDVQGNLANWMIPGQKVTGMGGAMDLVNGAKCVIVMLQHENKAGIPKLVERCKLPLTGAGVVNTIVTDKGMFEPKVEYFLVRKLAPGVTLDDLKIPRSLLKTEK